MAKQAKKTKERKPTKFEIMVRENPARAIVVGLGVLLLIRVGLFLTEGGPSASAEVSPTAQEIPTPIVFEKELNAFLKPKQDFEKSDFEILASANMFDPKQVIDPGPKVRAAEKLYQEAQVAFETWQQTKKKEDLQKANEAVNNALETLPNHFQARRLRDTQIRPALGEATNAAKLAAVAGTTTGTAAQASPAPAGTPAP